MTDHREAVEAARALIAAEFATAVPVTSQETAFKMARALLSLSDRVEEARKEERERCAKAIEVDAFWRSATCANVIRSLD
jgi:hypothetical protein